MANHINKPATVRASCQVHRDRVWQVRIQIIVLPRPCKSFLGAWFLLLVHSRIVLDKVLRSALRIVESLLAIVLRVGYCSRLLGGSVTRLRVHPVVQIVNILIIYLISHAAGHH